MPCFAYSHPASRSPKPFTYTRRHFTVKTVPDTFPYDVPTDNGLQIHYFEFRGKCPPPTDVGHPGDVWLDLTPGNYALYACMQAPGQWARWPGPRKAKKQMFAHPLLPGRYLWCTRKHVLWYTCDGIRKSASLQMRGEEDDFGRTRYRAVGPMERGGARNTERMREGHGEARVPLRTAAEAIAKILEMEEEERRSGREPVPPRRKRSAPPPESAKRARTDDGGGEDGGGDEEDDRDRDADADLSPEPAPTPVQPQPRPTQPQSYTTHSSAGPLAYPIFSEYSSSLSQALGPQPLLSPPQATYSRQQQHYQQLHQQPGRSHSQSQNQAQGTNPHHQQHANKQTLTSTRPAAPASAPSTSSSVPTSSGTHPPISTSTTTTTSTQTAPPQTPRIIERTRFLEQEILRARDEARRLSEENRRLGAENARLAEECARLRAAGNTHNSMPMASGAGVGALVPELAGAVREAMTSALGSRVGHFLQDAQEQRAARLEAEHKLGELQEQLKKITQAFQLGANINNGAHPVGGGVGMGSGALHTPGPSPRMGVSDAG
ncbi:hypothetical protein EVG20_g6857 [Dentipellis fragilis]|uniref:Uncharacterized protein n=1 Tax=Dentipellis fragilis TaxID=205917 RepID=A0A4Y9YHG6_9AGAM|nr:hypothetical protein EVG20_g6857 [Dentipellis fragilis]